MRPLTLFSVQVPARLYLSAAWADFLEGDDCHRHSHRSCRETRHTMAHGAGSRAAACVVSLFSPIGMHKVQEVQKVVMRVHCGGFLHFLRFLHRYRE